jgi:hypothetical protein
MAGLFHAACAFLRLRRARPRIAGLIARKETPVFLDEGGAAREREGGPQQPYRPTGCTRKDAPPPQ